MASDVGVALLLVGSVVCAFGVRELDGRWSLAALLPGVNLFVASALVTRRLGRLQAWRIVAEVILLVTFAVGAHALTSGCAWAQSSSPTWRRRGWAR